MGPHIATACQARIFFTGLKFQVFLRAGLSQGSDSLNIHCLYGLRFSNMRLARIVMAAAVFATLTAGCVPTSSRNGSSQGGAGQSGGGQGATLGTPVRDGKFEFTVTTVKRAHAAGDPAKPYLQTTAQGEFIIVGLTVKNIGDRAQDYFATNQKLTAAGKQYSNSFQAEVSLQQPLTSQINPGLAIDTLVAFDVPVGTLPDGIVLHDSALSDGVTVSLQGAPIVAG